MERNRSDFNREGAAAAARDRRRQPAARRRLRPPLLDVLQLAREGRGAHRRLRLPNEAAGDAGVRPRRGERERAYFHELRT